ncbi:hypothetical protein H1164_08320 [Thermoactinomyces daqus]|uniref:Uncharacterized protein n=1 Tax=Thermoactinomyces daqus TaxID=1329516 RepID=A0A7W1XA38_9BACL|nr:hypothetical protein [Thermoactinomyces daqus]MBA4542905.1 hypothetical protein [Thermoactinomyces daqus]
MEKEKLEMENLIVAFGIVPTGREVKGRCRVCGAEKLVWTDGGKIVCTECDSPQW